ncbi:MAG: alcohol dehydrogenase [Nitrospinae bacterium RIFCSPLOWO2_12_FULL_45_22]|nr:MAG: alcohol dehydrogenase [Nitrospinae bacterium RIFCSPLOWO2_12_FULL_45_22]
MRVAMYYNNRDIRVEEMPVPPIGPGELLIRVQASGICGSDVMEWYRIHKAPLVLGHEIAGEVVAVGAGVERYHEGDRVSVAHHVPCNTCYYCLNDHHTVCDTLRQTNFDPGGFAEYLRLPAINVDRGVYRLPDEVSYEEGTFTEPLACILRGQRIARIQPGQTVLVIGSGISGLLHLELARALGAGRLIATDVAEYRLEAARRFGAEAVIHAKEDVSAGVREVNNGRLADRVLVCTGAKSAITQALQSVERGGTVLFFAPTDPDVTIPISVNDLFFRNDITLTTSYAGSPADYTTAVELIRARRVRVHEMITHRLSLAETAMGFQLVAGAQDSIKVIIEPQR